MNSSRTVDGRIRNAGRAVFHSPARRIARAALPLALLALAAAARASWPAADPKPLPGSGECVQCHQAGPPARREPGTPPRFDAAGLRASAHAGIECAACHSELADVKEFPHAEKLHPVDCGQCHAGVAREQRESLHGQAAARGVRLAPTCKSCHGTHGVRPRRDPGSPINTINIPYLCNGCHREGSAVQSFFHIPQDSILANYSESIHGQGLFRMGLLTTAVCTSCHTAHHQLPHTDPRSSIAHGNVARTCMQCHVRIEVVHRKIINGALWEKNPDAIPACVDCHEPHRVRRVFYPQGMADRDCLSCHAKPGLTGHHDGRAVSMTVSPDELLASRHAKVACAQCHIGADPSVHRPCSTLKTEVDC